MFDKAAWMRAYLPAYKASDRYRAYENGYRAELRRRGLCIQCTAISVKFARCLECRKRANRRRCGSRRFRLTSRLDPCSV